MPQSDATLFNQWQTRSDGDAFAELLSRHANMVYGACLRVVKNPGVAEEVAQECFLELMKGPRGIQCIGAWLHTVATRRALDRVKSEHRRHDREKLYAGSLDTAAEASWDDTREFVDEAIASLPNDLRIPIVLRFLEGRTHEAIAEELSISRSSARSRIDRGIETIRENLAKRGVLVSAVTLGAGLESALASSAPHALIAELGKRVLAAKSATTVVTGVTAFQYGALALLLAGAAAAGWWIRSGIGGAEKTMPRVAMTATTPLELELAPVSLEGTSATSNDPRSANESSTAALSVQEENRPVEVWRLDLTPSEAAKEGLQQLVNVQFVDIHIKDIAMFLGDAYSVNLVLDQRVVAPEVEERDSGLQTESTAPESTIPKDGGAPFARLPQRYITDGMVRMFEHKGKTIEEALTVITSSLNLIYKIRGNTVWISSSAQLTEDLTVPLPSAPFNDGEILKALSSSVDMAFEDIHISGVLEFLQESYGVNIVLDTRAVMPQTRVDESETLNTTQFASDGMVGYINLKGISMAESLFIVTRLVNLTYRVGKDGIYISTPDRLTGSF